MNVFAVLGASHSPLIYTKNNSEDTQRKEKMLTLTKNTRITQNVN